MFTQHLISSVLEHFFCTKVGTKPRVSVSVDRDVVKMYHPSSGLNSILRIVFIRTKLDSNKECHPGLNFLRRTICRQR